MWDYSRSTTCSLCPKDANSFYLQPLQHPTPTCWYSTHPLGHNSLQPWQNSVSLQRLVVSRPISHWGLQLPVNCTDLTLTNSWLWRGSDIKAWKESAPINAHLMTNVKHSLISQQNRNCTHRSTSTIVKWWFCSHCHKCCQQCAHAVSVSVWENKQPSSPHSLTSLGCQHVWNKLHCKLVPWLVEREVAMWKEMTYGHVFRLRLGLTTLF